MDTSKKGYPMTPIKYTHQFVAFVGGDGSYGVEELVTFDYAEFAERYPKAWAALEDVTDNWRVEFILAVLSEDENALRSLAEDYDLDL